jgi:hypothetical protein
MRTKLVASALAFLMSVLFVPELFGIVTGRQTRGSAEVPHTQLRGKSLWQGHGARDD